MIQSTFIFWIFKKLYHWQMFEKNVAIVSTWENRNYLNFWFQFTKVAVFKIRRRRFEKNAFKVSSPFNWNYKISIIGKKIICYWTKNDYKLVEISINECLYNPSNWCIFETTSNFLKITLLFFDKKNQYFVHTTQDNSFKSYNLILAWTNSPIQILYFQGWKHFSVQMADNSNLELTLRH